MHKSAINPGTFKMLSGILASTYVLSVKVWNFHVNFVGPDFTEKHAYLGDVKDSLYDEVDSLAEQIRKLCGISPFSLDEFKASSVIKESPARLCTTPEVFNALYSDLCTLDAGIDKAMSLLNEDLVTQNLLIEIRTKHDKLKWFARSVLGQV